MSKLKPCPFCGSEMVQCYDCFGLVEPSQEPMYWTAECTTCGAQIYKPDETDAIAAWNHRQADTELVEALEDADEMICTLCKRLNPQHKNCEICGEREVILAILTKYRSKD